MHTNDTARVSSPETVSSDAPIETATEPAKVAGDSLRHGSTRLFAAKVFFLGAGLVQQVLLPHALGLEGYGLLARVLAPLNVVNNVAVGASMQNASKATASGFPKLAAILSVQLVLAALVVTGLYVLAPLLAAFQHAPAILLPLRLGAVLCGLYVVYAALVGVLNGRQAFAQQGALDMTAATLRTAGLVGGGLVGLRVLGSGPLGAVLGTVLAGASMIPIAWLVVKPRDLLGQPSETLAEKLLRAKFRRSGSLKAQKVPIARHFLGIRRSRRFWARVARVGNLQEPERLDPFRRGSSEGHLFLVRSVGALAAAQLVTNLLLQADIMLLGRVFAVRGAISSDADRAIGVYRACQMFSLLPYQLVASVSLTLFPLVAKVRAGGSASELQELVHRGLRLGAVLAAVLVAVTVALPGPLLRLAFGVPIATLGLDILRPLGASQGILVLGALASTVLVALGEIRRAAFAGLVGLGVIIVGILLIGPGADPLRGTALWLGAGFAAQACIAFGVLLKCAPGAVPGKTFLRAACLVSACLQVPSAADGPRLAAVALAPVVALVAVLFLAATGEWTHAECMHIRSTVASRFRPRA